MEPSTRSDKLNSNMLDLANHLLTLPLDIKLKESFIKEVDFMISDTQKDLDRYNEVKKILEGWK